jgi:hypothetical protein
MTMNSTSNIDSAVDNELSPEQAYARVLPELEALRPEELVHINLEVLPAIATVLGSLPEIQEHREAAAELRCFDAGCFDRLEDYARALLHAHNQHAIATEAQDNLPGLAEEAYATRERLHLDAIALTGRGMIEGAALKRFGGAKGYLNVAADLNLLVAVFRARWEQASGRSGVEAGELDRAEKLAMHIVRLVGLREQSPAAVAAVADRRARAFTLFVKSYDQVRRAISFVRWNERDVETIAPSLYAGRKRKDSSQEPEAPTPLPPIVGPGTGDAPVAPQAGEPVFRPLVAPAPGNNPFLQ